MKGADLIQEYLAIFCSGERLARMYPLFCPDLYVKGPLFEGQSAKEYVEALEANPPLNVHATHISIQEDKEHFILRYTLHKADHRTLEIQQTFLLRANKIASIHIEFS